MKALRPLVLSMVLLSSCAGADTLRTADGTAYGPLRDLRGIAENGFEVDSVTLCARDRATCTANQPPANRRSCWIEHTPAAREQLMRLTKGQAYSKYGYNRYWMEFSGRQTRAEGQYGHLGAYPCRILVEDLRTYDPLPAR